MPVFWWMRLDLVFLVGRTASGGVYLGCLLPYYDFSQSLC